MGYPAACYTTCEVSRGEEDVEDQGSAGKGGKEISNRSKEKIEGGGETTEGCQKASQKHQKQKTASGSRVRDQKQKASHTHQTALCAHCVTGSVRKERTVQCQWSALDVRSGSTSKAVY